MLSTALLWLLLAPQDAANAPLVSLSPPAAVSKVGTRVIVGTYFRNGGKEEMKLTPPVQIDAEIVTPNSRSAVALARKGEWPDDRKLAPGESLFAEYELELPKEVSGRVLLEVKRFATAATVIEIETVEKPAETSQPAASADPDSLGAPKAVAPAPEDFSYAEAALQRFHPYEPMYAVAGTDRPSVRFQFSFQYQIFNPEGPWASKTPFLAGLFLGYTQTGLWDTEGKSLPFEDTNYKPDIAWSKDKVEWLKIPGVDQVGLQSGFGHESNGQDEEESRSISFLYLKPILHFGDPRGFSTQVAPKLYVYLSGQENNEDIEDFRGYCDLKVTAGWADGFQTSALGRLGAGGDHGSMQFDLTFPLRKLTGGNLDMYLQLQWFSGYGESLITYDEYTDALRIGLGLVR